MFCYSSSTFCAHNHFPHKLLFQPKMAYMGYKVSYGYILDLFIASIIDSNLFIKSEYDKFAMVMIKTKWHGLY